VFTPPQQDAILPSDAALRHFQLLIDTNTSEISRLEKSTRTHQDGLSKVTEDVVRLRGELSEQAKDMDFICEQAD
jgi:hypothetical protein